MSFFKPSINAVNKKTAGFTLLEVLVVLVLIGLLSTLLLQAFSYTLTLRTKILKQLGRVQNQELVESWFRLTTSNFILKDKYLEEPLPFKGSIDTIKADTTFSLTESAGKVHHIKWRIETDSTGYTRLFYSTNPSPFNSLSPLKSFNFNKPPPHRKKEQNEWEVAKWFQVTATFSYLDKQGQWHENWPTKQYPEELPVGIMLNVTKDNQPFFWYSRMKMDKKIHIIDRFSG